MSNGSHGVHQTLSYLLVDPIGRLGGVIIGIVIAVLLYENLVMIQKDAQLISKEELIRVKDERIKQINDQVTALNIELSYKPLKEKRLFEELTQKNIELIKKNEVLSKMAKTINKSQDSELSSEKLVSEVIKLKRKNIELSKKLSSYESHVLIDNKSIESGESWAGFGGRVIFGVKSLSVTGYAKVQLSVDGVTESSDVWPGKQLGISLGENNYLLNIRTVRYAGSRVVISVSKADYKM